MTIRELLQKYVDGDRPALETIRQLSGMFSPKSMSDRLTLINQITRIESKHMDIAIFCDMYELKLKNE